MGTCRSFLGTSVTSHETRWLSSGTGRLSEPRPAPSTSSQQLQQRKGTVYVHWPFCSKLCTYCNFNKYVRKDVDQDAMADSLVREVGSLLRMSSISHVTSIYFGGGTPSLARPSTIAAVINGVATNATLDSNAEINLEANPTSELDKLSAFKDAGVTRLSLGVQSLNDKDLELLNRDHTSEQAKRVIEAAKRIFPGRVNVDMIFGRPKQTCDSWVDELNKVASMCSNHLSLYQLTVERGTALSKSVMKGETILPDADLMADMYEATVGTLASHGFQRYEISNFSYPGYESQHNLAYWRGSSYVGIGPGAHSRFRSAGYDGYVRSVNVLEPNAWMRKTKAVGHGLGSVKKISNHERLEEIIATSLRTSNGLTEEIWNCFITKPLHEVFSHDHLFHLYKNDFLVLEDSGLKATSKGLQVLDSILPECCAALESTSYTISNSPMNNVAS